MTTHLDRIRHDKLKNAVVSAEEAASWIKNGMTLGLSGFTRAGDAKAVPLALIEHAKDIEDFKVNVFTGASLSDVDRLMAEAGIVNKRVPYQAEREMRDSINKGDMLYMDVHLSHMAEQLRAGAFPEIDFAIVEAIAITEDGHIIPSTSVGNSSIFVQQAKKVIIELNIAQPKEFEGLHDIYDVGKQFDRDIINLKKATDRIGTIGIPVDPEKIAGIVFTNQEDSPSPNAGPDEETQVIADNLIDFLKTQVEAGHLPMTLAPIQSGIGAVANAVLHGLLESDFHDLEVWSEVLQDAVFDLIDAGKVKFASCTSITLGREKMDQVYADLGKYKDKLVLRPQEISNHPELVRRIGTISINTALEADIYGNVNSTHVSGTHMMNGIGGSGDFARNARLTIFVTKSIAKGGDISSIVPFVTHADHTEHDVDVIVTEQGYADLRGLAPRERAQLIIENVVHPDYRPQMNAYVEEAKERGGHTPHVLEKAFSWHTNLKTNGTMLQKVEVQAK